MKRTLFILSYIGLLSIILWGCKSADNTEKKDKNVITVAAASDLSLAFPEIVESFEKKTSYKVQLTFGSSGTLTQQIENGAPYDVFASANTAFIEILKEKERTIPETQILYGQGRIGIATKDSAIQINGMEDLLNPEIKKIAIASPEHAPYGMAAKEALQSLEMWEELKDKLVYGKSISDALTLVKTGNAEAGIISHAIISDDIPFVLIDSQLHSPINQSITVVNGTKKEKIAKEFVHYVRSSEGKKILQKYGFNIQEVSNDAK